jgi:hypothetical protein
MEDHILLEPRTPETPEKPEPQPSVADAETWRAYGANPTGYIPGPHQDFDDD